MTLVVAHRGASGQAPENTMAAFERAVEVGADAIELDVHLSADGQLAVIHDETVERTTDGTGSVASMTMDELRRLDAGYRWTDASGSTPHRGRGLRIPTLDEVLTWLPSGVGLVVEMKAHLAADAVVAALRRSVVAQQRRASVISFEERAIERVHELDAGLATGYLLVPTQPLEPALRWAAERGHVGVHPWEGDLGMDPAPALAVARAYGLLVGCYVVNDPDRMRHLAPYGLWGFVTDVPDVARAALGPRAS
ncbi:MAG TPA: glycerophosphodiester phosphodiesterase family protein [Candidatus Limnocylindria bacterium]|nr:glycerophosphodiester phosphodiesterase family protein [Candidatus Limnocylindria bacterium]